MTEKKQNTPSLKFPIFILILGIKTTTYLYIKCCCLVFISEFSRDYTTQYRRLNLSNFKMLSAFLIMKIDFLMYPSSSKKYPTIIF